eukprot:1957649-Amphidinium_carterae.1
MGDCPSHRLGSKDMLRAVYIVLSRIDAYATAITTQLLYFVLMLDVCVLAPSGSNLQPSAVVHSVGTLPELFNFGAPSTWYH